MKIFLWVPSFSRARRSFLLFLGRLLCRRARYCPSLFFSGWSSIFMFSSGRASMRWVGPTIASLRLAPVRAASCRRGLASCMSAELGGAHFLSSSSYMLVVPRANLHFQHDFPLFRRRLESVCVCVCVCLVTSSFSLAPAAVAKPSPLSSSSFSFGHPFPFDRCPNFFEFSDFRFTPSSFFVIGFT